MTILKPNPTAHTSAPDPALPIRSQLLSWATTKPATRHDTATRIAAHVYGNMTVLAAMLVLVPGSAVSSAGALVVLGASLSTFIAHAFSDLLGRRIGHDHRSAFTAAAAALRDSIPILSAAIVPLALLTIGGWAGWSEPLTQLAAELFICVRIGTIGALAERLRGEASSPRLILVGVMLSLMAAGIAIAKLFIS